MVFKANRHTLHGVEVIEHPDRNAAMLDASTCSVQKVLS